MTWLTKSGPQDFLALAPGQTRTRPAPIAFSPRHPESNRIRDESERTSGWPFVDFFFLLPPRYVRASPPFPFALGRMATADHPTTRADPYRLTMSFRGFPVIELPCFLLFPSCSRHTEYSYEARPDGLHSSHSPCRQSIDNPRILAALSPIGSHVERFHTRIGTRAPGRATLPH